jgi:hypothetical protein
VSCQELLGRWYELPFGLLVAGALFLLLRRRVSAAGALPAASLALSVGGVSSAALIIALASWTPVAMAWLVPSAALWLWLAALVLGGAALGLRTKGSRLAYAGLAISLLSLSPWVWFLIDTARNPW